MIEYNDILSEASPYRSDILKNIENNFNQLKKDIKDKRAKKEIINNIRQFSNIKNVTFTIKPNYLNAFIIPHYTRLLSLDFIEIFKDYKSGDHVKNLELIEEPSKYIQKISICFGADFFENLSARELTSILLHELGHAYIHTSNLPQIFIAILDKIGRFGSPFATVSLMFFNTLTFAASTLFTIIFALITRTATFMEHQCEYKADQFSAKYGYGDDLIKVLYKFHRINSNKDEFIGIKIIKWISEILRPPTHPEDMKRIDKIYIMMLNDYKKMYPTISKELSIILSDVKKDTGTLF